MVYFWNRTNHIYKQYIQTKTIPISDIVYNSRQTSEPVKVLPVGLDNNYYENH